MSLDPSKMVAVPVSDFINHRRVPTEVYIRLSDDKFILIAKAGAKLEMERLSKYQEKDIRYLYVSRLDYDKHVQKNLTVAGIALKKGEYNTELKTRLLHEASKSVLGEIEDLGFTEVAYEHAKAVTENTVELVSSKVSLINLLESIKTSSDGQYGHALATSAVSVMIGSGMDWITQTTLEKLALAGLLHDIGVKELPREIQEKPRADMSKLELDLYQTHPFRGTEILKSIGIVPDDVIAMVGQHHENSAGQGYPRRLRDLRIHPLAKVIALADCFVELTLPDPTVPMVKSPIEAYRYIDEVMGQPFNKECFKALGIVIVKESKMAS